MEARAGSRWLENEPWFSRRYDELRSNRWLDAVSRGTEESGIKRGLDADEIEGPRSLRKVPKDGDAGVLEDMASGAIEFLCLLYPLLCPPKTEEENSMDQI